MPARWSAGRRSVRAVGLANPLLRDARASGWASQPHPDNRAGRLSQSRRVRGALGFPIARETPRGLANPWRLPALHSLFREGEGNGRRVYPHPNERVAERWLPATSRRKKSAKKSALKKLVRKLVKKLTPAKKKKKR